MLSVAEARARILDRLRPTQAEIVALPDAWGRVTAAPVLARLTHPPADVSAMDGYALRAADALAGARLRRAASAVHFELHDSPFRMRSASTMLTPRRQSAEPSGSL